MMALQKSLMEQSDITGMLKDFDLQETEDGLVILKPPIVRFPKKEEPGDEEKIMPREEDL